SWLRRLPGLEPRSPVPKRSASLFPVLIYAFCRLSHQLIDNIFQLACLLERRQLPIGARAVGKNRKGVFDFGARSEVVDHVVDEPANQLTNEIGGRQLLALAEIYELAAQAIADRTPFILLDQRQRIDAEGEVVAAELPEFGDDRL